MKTKILLRWESGKWHRYILNKPLGNDTDTEEYFIATQSDGIQEVEK